MLVIIDHEVRMLFQDLGQQIVVRYLQNVIRGDVRFVLVKGLDILVLEGPL